MCCCALCKNKWFAPVLCVVSICAWYFVKTYNHIDIFSIMNVDPVEMTGTAKTPFIFSMCLLFTVNFIAALFYLFYRLTKKFEGSILCGPILAVTVLAYLCLMGVLFYPTSSWDFMTREGGPVDITTYTSYVVFFITMVKVRQDYTATKQDKVHWCLFSFFALICLLREMGAQHWLPSKDSTSFKIKFFTNPMNPIHEKIIAGIIVLIVVAACLYAAYKWAIPLVKGFFVKRWGAWLVGTMIGCGLLCKVCDRMNGFLKSIGYVWERRHFTYGLNAVFEEGLEIMLPILATVALLAHHKNKDAFY